MLTELFMGISGVLAAIMAPLIIYAYTLYQDNTSKFQEKDEQVKRLKYLLHEANERADRNAAIAQGLGEELAALKAYDPDEIDERLKKIREIKAEEARREYEYRLQKIVNFSTLNAQLMMMQGCSPMQAQLSPFGMMGR